MQNKISEILRTPGDIGYEMCLKDKATKSFLFLGKSVGSDDDHVVYARPEDNFKSDTSKNRARFRIINVCENKYRIYDVVYSSYLFVGRGTNSYGDHTVYARPRDYFGSKKVFKRRTIFQIVDIGNGIYRICDVENKAYLFVDKDKYPDGDHNLLASTERNFKRENFLCRTSFLLSIWSDTFELEDKDLVEEEDGNSIVKKIKLSGPPSVKAKLKEIAEEIAGNNEISYTAGLIDDLFTQAIEKYCEILGNQASPLVQINDIRVREKIRKETAINLIELRAIKVGRDIVDEKNFIDEKAVNELKQLEALMKVISPETLLKIENKTVVQYLGQIEGH